MYRNRTVRDLQRQWQQKEQRYLDYIDRLLDRIQRPEQLDQPTWLTAVETHDEERETPLMFDLENVG